MNRLRALSFALVLLDVATGIVVFNLASHFRGLGTAGSPILLPLLAPLAAVIFAIHLIDGYKAHTDMMSADYTSQHIIGIAGAGLWTFLLTYAFIPAGYELQSSRFVIALSFIALAPITLSYRRAIYQLALRSRGTRALVFLGDRANWIAFREECNRMHLYRPLVYAVASEALTAPLPAEPGDQPRPFHHVLDEIESGRLAVEAIILRESAHELTPETSRRLIGLYFRRVPTFTLELFHQIYWRKIPLYRLNQTWLFQEGFEITREPVFERLKRASDLVLASLGLLLAAPLIALSAAAVWLEDRGPVFFFQTRIGKNHVPFRLVKLRTMRAQGEHGDLYTQRNDPRITRVGAFLRNSRLDELPQLWNVLVGHMSLIGPRAEWDRLVENYEREIPCYYFRHLVKPGITGWAQVNYPYGASLGDTLRKLEYDLYYLRHFSFGLDATIVLKTIHIMLFGKGR